MPRPRRRLRSGTSLRAGFAAVRQEHEVPVSFSPEAADEAERAGAADDGRTRRDLTDVPFVTLDPPGSQDLDQAMHLARRGHGYRVTYAIADVAAVVRPRGALDRAAHERVMTIYCPDVRVPLHPPVLSEDGASLLPGVDRRAVVWTLDLDADGELVRTRVERATVRSRAQLDYPTEQARADRGVEDSPLALLHEIGSLRRARERDRGGVSLAKPSQEVVETPGGWGLELRAPLPVEEDNAQISLLTGTAAAAMMLEQGVGVLRTMPTAADRDVERLRLQASALGVPWPAGQGYGEVLATLDRSTPGAAAFLAAATSLFRGAAWTPFEGEPPAEASHGAVAAPYAHVTAPLRRLVDRYGTEVCLAADAGTDVPDWVLDALPGLAGTMATGARRAAAVDRACTDLVEAAVLAPHVGETFEGVALDGRTVQLTDHAVVARTEDDGMPAGERVRVELVVAEPSTRTVLLRRLPDGGHARP